MAKATRLYLSLRTSVAELFKVPVRWIRDTMGKESSFEKPYLTGEYRTMHLNIPEPDWPDIKTPDIRNPNLSGITGRSSFVPVRSSYPVKAVDGPPCPPCGIVCWAPADGQCDEWIECHMGIYCTGPIKWTLEAMEGAIEDRVMSGEQGLVVEVFPITNVPTNQATGEMKFYNEPKIFNIKQGPWASVMPSIKFKVDRNQTNNIILVTATQKDGSKCTEVVELACCDCAETTAISIDDASTPDEIDPGGEVIVYAINGCPPFWWDVTGLGYTLSKHVTYDRTVTLTSASGA